MKNNKPIAYYGNFHVDTALNFQLNRLRTVSTGKISIEETVMLGTEIENYSDVTKIAFNYFKGSLENSRKVEALAFLRLAEFFCFEDEEKNNLYKKFRKLFYEVYDGEYLLKHEVPYENGALSVLECLPKGKALDTVVVHGGGDSFIEEFYPNVVPLTEKGYRVIMFEGPGQGQTLHKYKMKMTHEWEKPVGAVLNYFMLEDVTLIGISLGGYFALRAAAFDKRITKLILWGVVYDFFECLYSRNGMLKYIVLNMLVSINAKTIVKKMMYAQMKKVPEMKWLFEHSLFVHGVNSIFDFLKRLKKYNTKDISKLINQDVLVMVGEDDHIIPSRMYIRQMKALIKAKSLKGRVFKRKEHASSHCQVGNIQIAIDEITLWLESLK